MVGTTDSFDDVLGEYERLHPSLAGTVSTGILRTFGRTMYAIGFLVGYKMHQKRKDMRKAQMASEG